MTRKNAFGRAALVTALACAMAFCFALAGCGGSDTGDDSNASGAAAQTAQFAGYWQLESMSVDDTEIAADDMRTLRELGGTGSDFIIYLAEDGTGAYDAFGEVEDLAWDADKATITTSSDNATMEIAIEDGKLVLREGSEGSATFARGDDSLADQLEADRKAAEEGPAASGMESGTDAAATTQPIGPITVADDDVCSIVITEKAVDDWGDAGYVVDIQNKTDRRINVWIPSDVTAVGGTMTEMYGSSTLLAGTTASKFFYFDADDGVVTGIDGLADVQTTFEVYDADSYDDLASYTVAIP